MAAYDGWPPAAISLVERAIQAHGGRETWLATRSVRLPVVSASGVLLTLKGWPRTFRMPREYEVFPHEHVCVFHGYPRAGEHSRYENGSASIDGNVSAKHRQTFDGLAKLRRWSPMDALYFFGYALCHYHSLPFTLGESRLLGMVERRGIEVEFAPEVETHSRRQRFYFGDDGRIVRHDYVADVIGPMARGAHLWEDYERSGGLLVARRRRVVARIGTHRLPLAVLRVQLGSPVVLRGV